VEFPSFLLRLCLNRSLRYVFISKKKKNKKGAGGIPDDFSLLCEQEENLLLCRPKKCRSGAIYQGPISSTNMRGGSFYICQLFWGWRKKPVAFPQKRSVTSEWWTIVYCYILVKENKQNIKERRRPTSWLFSLRDHPLSSRNNFRFHMETKISRHPIDWQYTSRYILFFRY